MGWNWRFRRRLRIGPGATLNLGKRFASLSLGVRGAHLTAGPRGRRVTIGAPGTGLSATKTIGAARHAPGARAGNSAIIGQRPGPGDVAGALIVGVIAFALLRWHGDKPLPAFLIALALGAAVGVRQHRVTVFVLLLAMFAWLGWLG